MSTFLYKCNFCSTEMEYDDSDKFCCVCGNKIDFEIQDMQKEAQKLFNKSKELSAEYKTILETYSDENIVKTGLIYDKYYRISKVIAKKSNAEILKENKYLKDKIKALKQRRKDEGYAGTDILELDLLYKYSWYKYCKRLYPTCDKSEAVSPEHTYNAYICNHNKRNFVGADIFSPLNIMFKNNTILKKDGGINILLFNDGKDKEDETIIFPSYDMKFYGFENYEELFDYEYSEKNVNKDKNCYMVKQGSVVNDKDGYFELIKKGIVTFIDKSEYENMAAYYNDIIDKVKNTGQLSKKFNYYDMLDEMYEKYKTNK